MEKQHLKKFRVALYGVLIHERAVLLTETRVPSGTIVNLPGGGLELGEDPEVALRREFSEETGLEITIERLLYCTRRFHQNPEFPAEQLMHIYYKVAAQDETKLRERICQSGNGDDVAGVLWCTKETLPLHRIQPVDLEYINSAYFLELI